MRLVFIMCLLTYSNIFAQKDSLAEITNISIDSMGDLRWTTTYYVQKSFGNCFSIVIEQLKNEKWDKIAGGIHKMAISKNPVVAQKIIQRDSTRVKFKKGINIYRLKMTFPSKIISPEIQLISNVSNDDGSLMIMGNKIFLDNKEYYEILNQFGEPLLKGDDRTIDISTLSRGSYFLYTKKSSLPFTK